MVDNSEAMDVHTGDLEDTPRVAVVILNWNNYPETAACLETLRTVSYPNLSTIVVDNGSTDGSAEKLAREFDFCEFVRSETNRGFAGGCNYGIDHAMDGTEVPEYILLLNNDIVVEQGFLAPLVAAAQSREKVAGVGGIIKDGSGEIWFAGGDFTPWLCRGNHRGEVAAGSPYETEFITGAMFLLDTQFLEDVGRLNEDYFFGMEDVDISLAARERGWKLLIAPDSTVTHNVSASAGQRSPFKYYHATRNRLQLASTHLNRREQLLFYILFSVTRIVRACQWAFEGHTDRLCAVYAGIIDYLSDSRFRRPESFTDR